MTTNSLTESANSTPPDPLAAIPHVSESAVKADKVSPLSKTAYALGGTTDIFGHWLYNTLANPVFNVFLGLSPTQVSLAMGVTRFVDAFTDPLFGWISDNTRSKWGRRRPFILFGSILSGLALPLLFVARPSWSQDQIFWFMLISASIYAPMISAYNMPYQSLGAELTPDYNERTSIMSWRAVVQKIAGSLLGAGLWLATSKYFIDPATGKADVAYGAVWAAGIAGLIMILSGFANFFFVKERYYEKAQSQEKVGFVAMFKDTFHSRPYLILLGIALVYAIPTGLVGTLGFYATTYYVFQGDLTAAGELTFWSGMSYAVFGVAGVPVASGLAKQFGKQKALAFTLAAGLVAFASSWWLYTPDAPWLSVLCTGLNGFSATGLWVVLPSMCADVVDYDEIQSGKRREGAYSSTFSWMLKVGMSVSMLIVGPLLDQVTGFNAKLGGNQAPDTIWWIRVLFAGIPVAALVVAFLLVQLYPLTRDRMRDIRATLEARRGTV
jgi:GPH family glycoside/pentoside/hexuronide:cation symporter